MFGVRVESFPGLRTLGMRRYMQKAACREILVLAVNTKQ
jgi:hypothetical protein